jgi:hypothetical protein
VLHVKAWIIENLSWLGFAVMSLIGAVIGHLKAYEAAAVEWAVKKHVWDLIRRACYACFIALVIAFSYHYMNIPEPVAFIIVGILSVFGSESIDWMFSAIKAKFAKSQGIEVPPKENK